jgi:hypothetical protein
VVQTASRGHLLLALVRLRAGGLDRRLAAGEPASASALLRERARQLLERRQRARLAAGWRRVLEDARSASRPRFSSAIPVRRDAVLIAEPAILALEARLREDATVDPIAIARMRVMLTDGSSPVYRSLEPDELRCRLLELLGELEREEQL